MLDMFFEILKFDIALTLKTGPRSVLQRVYMNVFSEETTEQNELN